ncbi:L,D-transpeptidase family protein [Rhizobium halophytocola]|uniref:Murein L,D-transpeptidase YcbB/YkuD n=1 Tax=Rhizobium halophytocola TaxID=735519 RepID=A0ABS4DZ40_9HYPH|nr:L,D-transpeptidase family protein [Rhizobium halophytocola]MBP1850963.1 murein L,D-transpeptidase YcbB/YkuD [Rhizobium halophytocola]
MTRSIGEFTLHYSTKKSVWATALVASIAASTLMTSTASATTLLDILRGGPGRGGHQQVRGNQNVFGQERYPAAPQFDDDPEPLPTVTGPTYKAYRPDGLRLVKASLFAAETASDVTTTASISADENGRAYLSEVKVKTTDDVADAVEAYYSAKKPLLWTDGEAVNDKAKAVMAFLAEADTVGLDPRDYAVDMPNDALKATDEDGYRRGLMQFEVALSSKALTYVADTQRGRIEPDKISDYYDFKRKPVKLKPVLNLLRLSPDVSAYLRARDPQSSQFQAMKHELARLREQDGNTNRIEIDANLLLKPGQQDAELPNVVAAIKRSGSDSLKTDNAVVLASYTDGQDYTPELVGLVKNFQKEVGLKPDGVVGPATVRKLVGDSNAEKIHKLIVAMEELRWLPDDLGQRYVFINQPAYRAVYAENGKEKLSMRVVVGGPRTQTYFFQDKIETVEVNPYWGIPQSIIVNEYLPKLRRNPGYLDQIGYETTYKGRKVSSTQVNWNDSSYKSVGVRQPPGGKNALGELKILFPNAHAIYMHDTPSKSFFQRDARALSHGCVRLQHPREMAAAVLGTSVDHVASEIAGGQNKALPVKADIPVYVAYFTAWPDKDGKIQYFNDVYDRDAYTQKAFDATSSVRESGV